MNMRPDILIWSPYNGPIATVEVKNYENLSCDIATSLHRNLLVHGYPRRAPYFLLLSQDAGYLWKQSEQESPDAPPTLEFPMHSVVVRYLPDRDPEKRLSSSVLELLVLQWLTELTWTPQEVIEEPERSLARSGFLESIREASVTAEPHL
jgi:hypothetical protein